MLYPIIVYCEDDTEGDFYYAVCPDFIGIETKNERLHAKTFGHTREKAYSELQEILEELAFEQLIIGNSPPKPSVFSAVQEAAQNIIKTHASNQGEWVKSYEVSWIRIDVPDVRIPLEGLSFPAVVFGTLVRKARDYTKQKWLDEHPHGNPEVKPVLLDDILSQDFDRQQVMSYLEHLLMTRTV